MAKNIHPINTVLFSFLLLVLDIFAGSVPSSKFMINNFELRKENLARDTLSLQGTYSEESYDKAI